MEASRTALKSLKVDGYISRLEVSFEDWQDDYHPHVHALIDSPAGGRGYIPPHAFQDAWLAALPAAMHSSEGGSHITPVRELEASCAYMTKSSFLNLQGSTVDRTVAAIGSLKGLNKLSCRNSLARKG